MLVCCWKQVRNQFKTDTNSTFTQIWFGKFKTTRLRIKKILLEQSPSTLNTYTYSNLKNKSLTFIHLQWGSEIQTSLDFEWSKRGWVANGLDFKWVLKYGSPVIWNHCHFVKKTKTFEIRKKCLNFECSGFWMVVTKAISIAKVRPF